jgi:hypothetical protein
MQLVYSGPKPLISSHGISFDNNKDDKFIYLGILAELIQALNHEYIAERIYTYNADGHPLSPDDILAQIRKCDANVDEAMTLAKKNAEENIEEELERAHNNHVLNAQDKEILIKNISMMRNYQINRAINKAVYYSGLTSLAELVKKNRIDSIGSSVVAQFTHVLHSLQGTLLKLRPPMDSVIDIYEHQGQLSVKLSIKHPQ